MQDINAQTLSVLHIYRIMNRHKQICMYLNQHLLYWDQPSVVASSLLQDPDLVNSNKQLFPNLFGISALKVIC